MSDPLGIALLFGGRSVEHAVSIRSARGVLRGLEAAGFTVLPLGIDPAGAWFTAPNPLGVRDPREPEGERVAVHLLPEPGRGLQVGTGDCPVDLYFPLVHGVGGEDGTLQGLFELAEVPYAGSGVTASALAMDKGLAKSVWRDAGLPVLDWKSVGQERWSDERQAVLAELAAWNGGALFIKPANGGSSVGVRRAATPAEREEALDEALSYDMEALVEPALDRPREIEVALLGNESLQASVPGEIVPRGAFYDYRAKYEDTGTELLVPAPVDEALGRELAWMAVRAGEALKISGLGRVDFLLDRDSSRAYISELNTLPGFTDVSMYPRLFEASGVAYPELLKRIVELGWERHRRRLGLRRDIR